MGVLVRVRLREQSQGRFGSQTDVLLNLWTASSRISATNAVNTHAPAHGSSEGDASLIAVDKAPPDVASMELAAVKGKNLQLGSASERLT